MKTIFFIASLLVVTNGQQDFGAFRVSCPAGMVCTDKQFCDFKGIQTQNIVELSPDEEARRFVLQPCKTTQALGSIEGFCCFDPFYQDPWPNGNGAGCPGRNFSAEFKEGPINAGFGEFPWQGIILGANMYEGRCSCSFTENNTCVTTASCVIGKRPEEITIGVGKWDISDGISPRPAQSFKALWIAVDPNFRADNVQNDIALIKIEKEVTLDFYIQPICLDEQQAIPTSEYDRKCVITGWGSNPSKDETLHWTDVDLLSFDECKKYFTDFDETKSACGRTDFYACKEDLGSGFQCQADAMSSIYYLKGAVSRVANNCEEMESIVEFSLIDFKGWFLDALRNDPSKYFLPSTA